MLKAGTAARRHTLAWDEPQTPAHMRESVEALLRAVDARLMAAAADWIGHVKILISGEHESAYASITASNDSHRWAGGLTRTLSHAELTIYAAIYSLTDSQVAQAIDDALRVVSNDGDQVLDSSSAPPNP